MHLPVRVRIGLRIAWQLALIACIAFAFFALRIDRVDGRSMVPTLQPDAFVLVDVRSGTPERGEIVAFRHERAGVALYVKRVIGIAGDRIAIDRGIVERNGVRLGEPYVTLRDARSLAPVVVPSESYFVLGDDRPGSEDSRAWGFVRAGDIEGRALASLWPPAAIGLVATALAPDARFARRVRALARVRGLARG